MKLPAPLSCALAAALSVFLVGCTGQQSATSSPQVTATNSTSASPVIARTTSSEDKKLRIYNWTEYVGPLTLLNFSNRFKTVVQYDTYESNEELQAKLDSGASEYDLVVPGATFAKKQIDSGKYQKWDMSLIPNRSNLDPMIMEKLRAIDPNNEYLIPWGWSYTTVGVNMDLISPILSKHNLPMPQNTWELVLNPTYTSKLKECGIGFLDSSSEVMPVVLHYIGKDAYSKDTQDHQLAYDALSKVRPDIKGFVSATQLIESIASRHFCVALGWSGDISAGINMHRAIGDKDDLQVTYPSTGALMFIDTIALTKDAKNQRTAHEFMNYVLEPKTSADITNATSYLQGNRAAQMFLERKISGDESVMLPPEKLETLIAPGEITPQMSASFEQLYTKIKE